jgi:light-regulated signal transduction histidine kinase (bacteriophytochrome)
MKYAERIFRPFQRLHGQDVYQGSGMGLAICRKIAERHRGRITVESRPDEGTVFKIRLPVYQKQKEKNYE